MAKGPFIFNGLTTGQSNPDWNNPDLDLPAIEAANFTHVVAKDLSPGSKIYRVTNGNPAGGYWTCKIPKNAGVVLSESAVRMEWNCFERFYEYEITSGGLKVWEGEAARQRFHDGSNELFLSGGAQQIFVPQVLRDQIFSDAIHEIPLPWQDLIKETESKLQNYINWLETQRNNFDIDQFIPYVIKTKKIYIQTGKPRNVFWMNDSSRSIHRYLDEFAVDSEFRKQSNKYLDEYGASIVELIGYPYR